MLKELKEIAFTNIPEKDVDQHECFIINTFLEEMYYYSKKASKLININPTLESIYENIYIFKERLMTRNTDIWEALYLLECPNLSKDDKYQEKHNIVYTELGGRKRTNNDLEKLFKNTLLKSSYYKENKNDK